MKKSPVAFFILLCSLGVAQRPLQTISRDIDWIAQLPSSVELFHTHESYLWSIDSETVYSGKNSLRFDYDSLTPPKRKHLSSMCFFSAKELIGKTITVSAYVKTKGVDGRAAPYLFIMQKNRPNVFPANRENGSRGTSDWTKYSFTLTVDSSASRINFGADLSGTGTAWFDELEMRVDGNLFHEEHLSQLGASTKAFPRFDFLNLNFEFSENHESSAPSSWGVLQDSRGKVSLDSEMVFSGKNSLRCYINTAGINGLSIAAHSFSAERLRGKKITYRGYVRTQNIAEGQGWLWYHVYEKDQTIASKWGQGISASSKWEHISYEFLIDSTATSISFGLGHTGIGTSWFDQFEILVDGAPIQEDQIGELTFKQEHKRQSAAEKVSGMDLDFARRLPFTQKGFYVYGGSHYRASLDSQIVHSGKNSLRFDFTKTKISKMKVATAMTSFEADNVRGRTISFSAYIRTKDVTEGEAVMRMFTTETNQASTVATIEGRGPKGTSDWKQYTLELEVSPTAEQVYFYVHHIGNGTAWFDGLEILVDGKSFQQAHLPPVDPAKILETLTAIREGTFEIDLDFEHGGNTPRGSGLWHYIRNDEYYKASFDSTFVHSGRRSLRIDFVKEGERTIGMANLKLPIEKVRGSIVTFTGYIRTNNVVDGEAYLWMRVDRKTDDDESSKIIAFDDSSGRGATGTSPWKQYRIEHLIDSSATTVIFGLLHTGKGTAWLDKVEVLINGKPLSKEPAQELAREKFDLNESQLSWLKKAVHPFRTAVAGSGFDDLAFIQNLIGNAEIIGLGEATHGTKEFFQMKHRLLEYIAMHNDHTIFVMEDAMSYGREINSYIHGDTGSIENVMGILLGLWNTQEVKGMIEWMRSINASGKKRIDFAGCDMQSVRPSRIRVMDFLKQYDSAFYIKAKPWFDSLVKAINNAADEIGKSFLGNPNKSLATIHHVNFASNIFNYLRDRRHVYLTTLPEESVDNIIRDANLLAQAAAYYLSGFNFQQMFDYRDSCMATNIRWIKNHAPKDTKIVIWAHNAHVKKNRYMSIFRTMGSHLRNFFGDSYRIFGFKFHDGSYSGVSTTGLEAHLVTPSYPGTLDWALHSAGASQFMLDLRRTSKDNILNGWLYKPLLSKNIGAMATSNHYSPEDVAASYDVLIFFDKTTAAQNLSPAVKKDE